VDPLTASALTATITALLNSAAGEAGKSAWTSLTGTARRLFGSTSAEVAALENAAASTETPAIEVAATQLLAGARRNPDFADFLTGWQAEAVELVRIEQGAGSVSNVVSPNAQIGKLFQGRDVHGDITF
jgi:hypothetical protein